ncbi:MAG TPA: hypothetical protein VNW68_00755 [Candidatus Limnocylindria bacterium]|nr:hypothetical protein [Candidatus Limnocylindria bacterium]
MVQPLSSLIRPTAGPRLPIFDRLAPPPPDNVVAAELTARAAAGDVVIDLHGRGGWIARTAIGALRRVYACESTALTRLLAEIVLRPPDLRHLDAAIATLALHPRGDVDLRRALNEPFGSRCPTCGRPVVVDEFIWEGDADAPARKVFRCTFCRDQSRGREQRNVAVDEEDIERARAMDARPAAWDRLRARFPLPAGVDGHELPAELLRLYTPRALGTLEAIVARLEADQRAGPIDAALRLGLAHALLPASRLNSYPARVAALRIRHGRVQWPGNRGWRERNPWLAFEEGCRQLRVFIQRIAAGTAAFQPRAGDDLGALLDGSANVVMRTGSPARPGNAPTPAARDEARNRATLVLSQPPLRWTVENLSFSYLATSIVLGREAAAELPLESIFGPPPRNDRAREATALRRSLLAVRPALSADARAVIVLDPGGPAGLVAGVLGGIGAGFTLNSALLAESAGQVAGVLEFELQPEPGDDAAGEDAAGEDAAEGEGAAAPPLELAEVEAAVTQVAVAVLQARGEPAGSERLLGEVLVGLDRLGLLRRLVVTDTFSQTEAAVEAGAGPSAGGADSEPRWALGGDGPDHVKLLMELVMGELRRPDHPRLEEIEPGRWWLRNEADIVAARPPLSDRLEWAAFGLLASAQGIDEAAFFERITAMFRDYDAPDQQLVETVLESYRDPASPLHTILPRDDLAARHAEHGALIGLLVEYGHRLGLRCWVSPHEQRRAFRNGAVGDLLSEDELRAYMPLIANGDVATLETTDCIWYLRGKATFLFEVEWTAMLTEPFLRRAPRIPADETIVRFLVIPPERVELVRLKLARSPLLRAAMEAGNWHILRSDLLRRLHAQEEAGLELMAPLLGLDPAAERQGEQLSFFEVR